MTDAERIANAARASESYEAAVTYGLTLSALGRLGGATRETVADLLAPGVHETLDAAHLLLAELDAADAARFERDVAAVLDAAVDEAAANAAWAVGSVGVDGACWMPPAVVAHAVALAVPRWLRVLRVYAPDPAELLKDTGA